tara:strand:- start:1683 stop:2363 length:681 start_codon:yes stop_codon:yes gene_type:complete
MNEDIYEAPQPLIETSPTIGKLAEALAKAQGEMGAAVKGSENTFYKNSYADLGSVIEAGKPIHKHGLSLLQLPVGEGTVVTMLMHSSGEWIRGTLTLKATKPDAQGTGSAISYARRYMQQALLNIPSVDDDGQAAVTPELKEEPQKEPKKAPRKAPRKDKKPVVSATKAVGLADGTIERLKVRDWSEGVSFTPELSSTNVVQKFNVLSDEEILEKAKAWREKNEAK